MEHAAALFLALVVDRLLGDPEWLWSRLPHPVVLFGRAIEAADRRFNRIEDSRDTRRRNGLMAIVTLCLAAALVGLVVAEILDGLDLLGFLLEALLVSVFLAQKSLFDHVAAVADGLRTRGLAGGRAAVARIVGRDPETLDRAGVARAAIESLAENFSDGVVAPAFWYVVLGLPGLFAYKLLNTADSMIGHLNDRHRDFGRAAARADDLANWIPARLTALLVAGGAWLGSGKAASRHALATARRDARLHRSPNAGWPEAAMAGALALALAGPRVYGGVPVREPMVNASGRRAAGVQDIRAGLRIARAACGLLVALALLLAFA